jgi:hypothetical protein
MTPSIWAWRQASAAGGSFSVAGPDSGDELFERVIFVGLEPMDLEFNGIMPHTVHHYCGPCEDSFPKTVTSSCGHCLLLLK